MFKPYLLPFVLLGAVATVQPDLVQAQLFSTRGLQATPGRFVTLPRILQQQLREAEDAIEDSRFNDAVVRLGDLLAREADETDDELLTQDFFLDASEQRAIGSTLTESFKVRLRKMIGDLPPAALETYELQYGPVAAKMLNEAATTQDWTRVREVRRRYFHTQAGYDASWLLAQNEMLQGRPIAASMLLDDIVTVPRAVKRLGNSILVMHAAACKLAKRKLPAAFPDGGNADGKNTAQQFSIGGVERSGPELGELSKWLDEIYGQAAAVRNSGQLDDYLLFNAGENRNGAVSGQMPLSNVRWQLDTTVSAKQEREISALSKSMLSNGQVPPPSWLPLRVGDTLLMRTTEYLVGVDYRTGKRVWLHPFSNSGDQEEKTAVVNFGRVANSKTDSELTDFLQQRVWNDLPYGQVTSDGERVYMLKDLPKLSAVSSPMLGFNRGMPTAPGGNSLVALELASEGMIKWFQGASSGPDAPLANAFFLGPPLPIEGRLYTMCELAGDIFLVCLEPKTGKEIWRQQLVSVESGTISRDRIRRVAGAMLSYQDGCLICPTGAAAMVVVNLGDRTLRWGVDYQRNSSQLQAVQSRGKLGNQQLLQRWFTGAAIISDLSVLLTPVESDRLLGFNLLTGERLFTPKVRLDMRYLAGIRGQKCFVVGPKSMKAYNLEGGGQAWKLDSGVFKSGQQISGQGVFGEDCYFLPTNTREIIQVSLENGDVLDRRETSYELGNLVAVDGEIITQGPTKLSVAFGEQTLVPLVERMLDEDPDNFDALVRKSELLIQSEEYLEALELLQRARKMQPENDEVRMLCVSGMLALVRESKSLDDPAVAELFELIDRPIQRMEFNALRLRLALDKEDYQQVAALLLELSKLLVSDFKPDDEAGQVLGDVARVCLLDAWMNGRVREFMLRADSELSQSFESQVKTRVEEMIGGTSERLERVLAHFDGMEAVEPVRSVLVQRYLDDEKYGLSEKTALGHLQPSTSGVQQLSTQRLLMLANVYAKGGMPRNAFDLLQQLKSRQAALTQGENQSVEQIDNGIRQKLNQKTWPKNASVDWKAAKQVNGRLPTANYMMSRRKLLGSLNVQAGEQFRGWDLMTYSSGSSNRLMLRNPEGGIRQLAGLITGMSEKRKLVLVSGGVMVVQTTGELFAIELFSALTGRVDPILWKRDISGSSGKDSILETTATPFGDQISNYRLSSDNLRERPEYRVGPILGDRLIVLKGGELAAIGLRSGESLWENSGAPKSGMVLCDGERVAVVSDREKEMVLYDVADGRELKRVPFQHGVLWRAAGQNVLCFQETEEENVYDLKVVNPFTGEVLLTQKANSSENPNSDTSAAVFVTRIFSGNYLAMMSPSGETIIWDFRDAREVVRTQVEPQQKLEKMRAVFLRDKVVLLPSQVTEVQEAGKTRLVTRRGESHHTADAAFAFSLEQGNLIWSKQFDQPWGCTNTQAMETPALVFARLNVADRTQGNAVSTLEVLAVNVTDGTVLDKPDPKPLPSGNSQYMETFLTVLPNESRMEAVFGGNFTLNLSFSDEKEKLENDEGSDEASKVEDTQE